MSCSLLYFFKIKREKKNSTKKEEREKKKEGISQSTFFSVKRKTHLEP
jgi:hypothetical protein